MNSLATNSILYSKNSSGVAWITFNQPSTFNAINAEIRDGLWEFLHAAKDDRDVRVLGFRAMGKDAFSSGADITEFGTAPSIFEARDARRNRDIWALLESIPIITVAVLHGYCFGAGIELALFCDFRIASTDTLIAFPEVALGYIPSAGGTQMIQRVSMSSASRVLPITGERIDSIRALKWGIVSDVVEIDNLDSRATEFTHELASRDTQMLCRAKESILRGTGRSLEAAIAFDADVASLTRLRGDFPKPSL